MIYLLLAWLSYPLIFIISRLGSVGAKENSFVVFQTAKIGDMVCTTPVFREIKNAEPSSRLSVVADPASVPVIRHNPYVDEIIPFDRKRHKGLLGKLRLAKEIRKRRFGAALILMPNAANILVPFWAMIPKRVAVYPDYLGGTLKRLLRLSTHIEYHIYPRTALETYLKSLRHLNIGVSSLGKEVYPSPDAEAKAAPYVAMMEGSRFVGIALGTGNAMKDWGKGNFMRLSARLINETPYGVIFLGSEKERPTGDALRASLHSDKRVINVCNALSLEDAPAVIKRLSLVIGVDTGLIYMADALNIPVVDIAGPCNTADQRPMGANAFIVQKNDLGCIPCSHTFSVPYECWHKHRRCITEITVDEVFKACLKALLTNENKEKARL
ncbi:MAG: glycosyltransferase family 9 protein [Deltaproteobacteria bacterium]|nr:glycosyltransferase family 9 protein [Deltaproteobacteria bacterium]